MTGAVICALPLTISPAACEVIDTAHSDSGSVEPSASVPAVMLTVDVCPPNGTEPDSSTDAEAIAEAMEEPTVEV